MLIELVLLDDTQRQKGVDNPAKIHGFSDVFSSPAWAFRKARPPITLPQFPPNEPSSQLSASASPDSEPGTELFLRVFASVNSSP